MSLLRLQPVWAISTRFSGIQSEVNNNVGTVMKYILHGRSLSLLFKKLDLVGDVSSCAGTETRLPAADDLDIL